MSPGKSWGSGLLLRGLFQEGQRLETSPSPIFLGRVATEGSSTAEEVDLFWVQEEGPQSRIEKSPGPLHHKHSCSHPGTRRTCTLTERGTRRWTSTCMLLKEEAPPGHICALLPLHQARALQSSPSLVLPVLPPSVLPPAPSLSPQVPGSL